MSNKIQFTVYGVPVGKARARFVRATGRTYTPTKTRSFEALLREYAHGAMNSAEPMQGPLRVTVEAVFPKAPSWSRKKADAAIWHTSKPDADNLVKCLDGLNGVVWRDDAQIADARVTKKYSTDGSAWLRVVIEQMGE